MTATITIVRHGNTFASGETPRRIGAATDLPLVSSGLEQARAIGRHFATARARFDRVLCSPLLRTRETARLILDEMSAAETPECCDWLREIDHGPDENKPENAVVARIGAKAIAAWDEHGVAPFDWIIDADSRLDAWRAFFAYQSQAGGSTLLVTSNGAARFALLVDPALKLQADARGSFKLRTGAWGVITLDDRGARIDAWDVRP